MNKGSLLVFPAALLAAGWLWSPAVRVECLRTCRLQEPSNIVKPVFSWKMKSARPGAGQKAYAITLRTADGNEVWYSGSVETGDSHAAAYSGPALDSATKYRWTVKVTDEKGRAHVSKPATFTTGLIRADDWNGSEWIAVPGCEVITSNNVPETGFAAPGTSCFFKRIANGKAVKEAYWTVTGQGVFQAYVNGRPLPDFLKPGFTHVFKTRHSFTYNVTDMLDKDAGGANVFSAMVSAGWWRDKIVHYRGKESAFRAQLILRYGDGSRARFGTDESWSGAVAGPVKAAGIFDGETYDARVKTPWMTTGADTAFKPVKTIDEFKGLIVPMEGAPISLREDLRLVPRELYAWRGVEGVAGDAHGKVKIIRRYAPGDSVKLAAGETLVVDFGQNAAAVPEFTFSAKAGTELSVKPAEMLNDENGLKKRGNDGPEGSVYRRNLRKLCEHGAEAKYTFAGSGKEFYRPEFTFFGYRYISVTASGDVVFKAIASVPVTSIPKWAECGSLATGVADVNRLISNVLWGQYSNYLSVPTDCPQRNERLGWTADTQVFCAAASRNADVYGFLCKFMRDMRDSQHENGSFTGVAPTAQYGDKTEQLGWSDAGIIIPYTMWRRYGDLSIVEDNFGAMEKYMELTAKNRFDSPVANSHQWADWLSYENYESAGGGGNPDQISAYMKGADGKRVPRKETLEYWHYLGGCYLLWDARMMAEMAGALGKADAAAKHREIAKDAVEYLKRDFFGRDGMIKECFRGMQTPALFALKFGLVEGAAAERTRADLLKSIADHGDCLQTGFLGTSILMDTLTYDAASPETAYTLMLQRKNPSWLYSVDQGATTIWERWNSYTKATGFGKAGMNSFNHYAYGAVLDWMYGTMAGIRPDPKSPGWKHFVLAPIPDRRIGSVNATYKSPYGKIKSCWKFGEDGAWLFQAEIPANTSATVVLPDGKTLEAVSGKFSWTCKID
ncbi:MAG: family 78 glycoside hydrolase catalytic domain [Kiritimatiellae bacterium]|nr:family 78 glycoside hydrolase catalytic domain [Kiritimatiellia bacterium]